MIAGASPATAGAKVVQRVPVVLKVVEELVVAGIGVATIAAISGGSTTIATLGARAVFAVP